MKLDSLTKYNLNFSEYQRAYIEGLLLSTKIELEDAIEDAKADDDEDRVEQFEENLSTVERLLDQIDIQRQEYELKAERE